ncbi:MAG: flavodoxin family protein [Clostridiales bacterium]|nr:flavodoxin family protein [Clostridiales bacterium]
MKVLLINGSPRRNSTTYKVVRMVVEKLRERDPGIEFEDVHLCEANLKMCRGCYQCFSQGEDRCPLQDDRALLERKLAESDAVIFSSPVYVANVSGLFKNFIDRFAYCCHRPRFLGKKAMVVCSAGSDGAAITNIILSMSVETWGFDVVRRLGINLDPNRTAEEQMKQWQTIEKKAAEAALSFAKAVQNTGKPAAKLAKLYAFQLQRNGFRKADPQSADYRYWSDKGWLDPKTSYYIDARINPLKLLLAKLFARFSRGK